MTPSIMVEKLHENARLPEKGTQHSSGYDLRWWPFEDNQHFLMPGSTLMAGTGIKVAIPEGYEGQIRGRSSIAAKGILTHPGTIDSDYRGELIVHLRHVGDKPHRMKAGDRIAQIVFAPLQAVNMIEAQKLDDPGTRTGGFGSTGR